MVINNFPIKFSVRPELVEGWTENSQPMQPPFLLRQAQHERMAAFREIIIADLKWLIDQLKFNFKIPLTEVFRHPVVSRKNPTEAATARW